MIGRKRFISAIGTPDPTPRIRRPIDAFIPATMPMPIVWQQRIAGNASSDGDSRTQMLKAVDSSQTRNACTPDARVYSTYASLASIVILALSSFEIGHPVFAVS